MKNTASYLVSKIENKKINGKLITSSSNENKFNLSHMVRCFEINNILMNTAVSSSLLKTIFNINVLIVIYDKLKYNSLYSCYKEYLKNIYTVDENIEVYSAIYYTINGKKYLRVPYSGTAEERKNETVFYYIEFINKEVLAIYSFGLENKISDKDIEYF